MSVMPTNLYGQGDNYHPEYSHVVAALIRRIHDAKVSGAGEVVVWRPQRRREFMFVDDMADACISLMKAYSNGSPINIGTGEDISIADFAKTVAAIVGFEGKIVFDSSPARRYTAKADGCGSPDEIGLVLYDPAWTRELNLPMKPTSGH